MDKQRNTHTHTHTHFLRKSREKSEQNTQWDIEVSNNQSNRVRVTCFSQRFPAPSLETPLGDLAVLPTLGSWHLCIFINSQLLLKPAWQVSVQFSSVAWLSLVAGNRRYSSLQCMDCSMWWLLPLQSKGCRHLDSVVVAHGLSSSKTCAIFLDQGSSWCPLHWQADSYPLYHQTSS